MLLGFPSKGKAKPQGKEEEEEQESRAKKEDKKRGRGDPRLQDFSHGFYGISYGF